MTPKSTIALEAAGSGPGRPGPRLPGPCEGVAGDDRLAALFAARKIITECWAHHYFKNLARA